MNTRYNIDKLISEYKRSCLLEKIVQYYTSYKLTPVFGYEIEFYLAQANPTSIQKTLKIQLTKEKGQNQYEIQQGPFKSALVMIDSIILTRRLLVDLGANLMPKPFSNDYGNSMHIHFNILDFNEINLFEQNSILHNAANGICHFMNQTLLAMLPSQQDYERLNAKFLSPTHISYGNNNRTTALRIPSLQPIRIEHRICSNTCDPYIALFIILKSSMIGIKNQYRHHQQIFGNASDEQYKLQKLAENILEAEKLFNTNFFTSSINS